MLCFDKFLVHVFIFCVSVNIIPKIFIISHYSSFNYWMRGYVKKCIILNYCWTCKGSYIHIHTVRTNYPCKLGTYCGFSTSREVARTENAHTHPPVVEFVGCDTYTFPNHTHTLSVTHHNEQNTGHLSLLLFLVWCAPSLNTKQSPVVATQLDASEQTRTLSSGPALSA
jgi:hypothetical protein